MDNHGVTTKETDNQTKAITTVNMSVIGLVGTAPDAQTGTAASVTVGNTILDNAIVFTAAEAGADGNQLQVTAVAATLDPDTPAAVDSSAAFTDGVLTITLGIDETGAVTATAVEVVSAVVAVADSGITAALYSGIAGAGIVDPFIPTRLAGGVDEPFPLYTPALISGSRSKAKQLGTSGTLYADMNDILAQTGALVIVVRVADDDDEDKQRANIIQGIEAMELAQGTLNYQPRILIAPEWSTDDGVGKSLESAATQLRAVTYLDMASMATPADAVRRGQMYGARVEILRPRIMVTDDVTGKLVSRPYSAAAAGHRMRVDSDYGYWWSKSNKEVYGFSALEQVDSYIIGNPNCVANQLNQSNVSTIIMMDSYKHWGNRLCIDDPQWRFEAVRRTADAIEDSIQLMVTKNYIDRPIDKAFSTSLLGSINSYGRQQTAAGVINGLRAWLDPDMNTAETLAAGKIYVNVAFGPKSPAEEIIITYSIDDTYTVQALGLAA
ncbi:phage tail sheath family protein [Klebsiella aerogenes]|uniref:phage tail sheath family protein n=1 Tax=Klebsiella aerogenes TaxID=548 RepID=UPI0034D1D376